MKIYIGADHRGFELKEHLKLWLIEEEYEVVDCGNEKYDPEDDFTDFSFAAAEKVQSDPESRGIVICGSGVGVNISANKVKGIRASTGINADEVRHARQHDDLNVLAISSEYSDFQQAKEMIIIFLTTPFKSEERYLRRLDKIRKYESLS
ncbi:MAG: RpiB/LacA/LacB family sugar-phosphate isomerase [Candidatus Pacebacteria bacterium]|jgi:ribose 5-phosphate isomerase B|nr:RpiB/LacA/LacB family sugar-phosphate isomerase [Candidatus Paceibacterota bacterium]MBT3511681.1 RpiB/LacA/LacB family sugar-phosphate isomerase [Candidatus Paceibacterota bacterium]MBT4004641.1 RpiB/LacA/LacB family sugar-phosphate isomerase [Candidatus Paceibacterota bacterium]MBT4359146.1 RpiB/LacA/LacB family sugar-phosphate isomerase [Candidatus Paceibacterota bacterium]MBT4680762.1 RpiB/LacA/LacB family sugar-phosphate isomerase [Candidatus Paceibacterota bacterium]